MLVGLDGGHQKRMRTMSKFHVSRIERHEQIVEVEADDREEARQLVANGQGELIGCLEFHSMTNPNDWSIQLIEE